MEKGNILIVEDNPDDEVLILWSLQSLDLKDNIMVVRDGAEALDYMFKRGAYTDREGGNPAIVVLDLKLPRVDGFEVLQRLRDDKRTERQPVVILTSSNEQEDKLRGYGLGCNSYVRKPVMFEAFSKVVNGMGLYWLHSNEPPPPGND